MSLLGLGAILAPSLGHLEHWFGSLVVLSGPSWVMLGPSGSHRWPFWGVGGEPINLYDRKSAGTTCRSLFGDPFRTIAGPSWTSVWASCGPLGAIVGHTDRFLGPSWGLLGDRVGPINLYDGSSAGTTRRCLFGKLSWHHLWAILGTGLGVLWLSLGLGRCWALLGAILGSSVGFMGGALIFLTGWPLEPCRCWLGMPCGHYLWAISDVCV